MNRCFGFYSEITPQTEEGWVDMKAWLYLPVEYAPEYFGYRWYNG